MLTGLQLLVIYSSCMHTCQVLENSIGGTAQKLSFVIVFSECFNPNLHMVRSQANLFGGDFENIPSFPMIIRGKQQKYEDDLQKSEIWHLL